ncbi:MAG: hypothetical protein SGJ09_03330 [Phycisphaerae bacterium]|nr:hypothetical protein [Phycisphaerae bacterium]
MELEELKAAWKSLDQRLAQQNALTFDLLKSQKTARARSALRPLILGQTVQIAAGVVMCLWFAPFWVKYIEVPHLLISGLLLHAYALMFIVLGARELHIILHIDYAAPVVAIQRQIAVLRNWRVRIGSIFAVTGCFIWIPLMLVILRGLGADVWAKNPTVVYWFIINGFAALGVVLGIIWWSRRGGALRLDDETAGRSVRRAQAAIEEIARFAHEPPHGAIAP